MVQKCKDSWSELELLDYNLISDQSSSSNTSASATSATAGGAAQPPLKRFKMLSQDTMNRYSNSSSLSLASGIEAEMDRYVAEINSVELDSGPAGPLTFWIEREASYPNLAPVALDLIAAPASEAYVERVFSVCGDMCSGKRNRMKNNLEQRVFLKMNKHLLKAEVLD